MTPARQYNDIFEAHERLYLVLMAALSELDAERRNRP